MSVLKVTQYVDSVAASKEDFFNAIVDERGWELGGEMIRKYDLVRWNLLGSKVNEMKEECTKMINNDPEYSNIPTNVFWQREDEVITILNPDYRIEDSFTLEGDPEFILEGLSASTLYSARIKAVSSDTAVMDSGFKELTFTTE